MKMKPKKYAIFFSSLIFLVSARAAEAFCPVCTLAVAGGVGLSRWVGVDDTVAGLWIGGVTVALIVWTIEWFKKKNINFFAQEAVLAIFYYAIIVLPLWRSEIIGHPLNKLWGADKLMIGIVLGSISFFFGGKLHFYLKKKNGDKVYFPFQKVAFSVFPLVVLSAVFYLITK